MTDKEVIKALECCTGGFCCGCPRLSNNMGTVACMRELINNALDLINRQQAEIEQWKEEANRYQTLWCEDVQTARAEAIKEFSYELKIKIGFTRGLKNLWLLDLIDNLVKEVVGDV